MGGWLGWMVGGFWVFRVCGLLLAGGMAGLGCVSGLFGHLLWWLVSTWVL